MLFASFSEAIREGAKLRFQAFRAMFRDGKTCALGAGADALGFPEDHLAAGCYPSLAGLYPYLKNTSACPLNCPDTARTMIGAVIAHLNDVHGWTRERIADWLEQEEEKLGYITVIEAAETQPEVAQVCSSRA